MATISQMDSTLLHMVTSFDRFSGFYYKSFRVNIPIYPANSFTGRSEVRRNAQDMNIICARTSHFQQMNRFVIHLSINFEQGIFAPTIEFYSLKFLTDAIVANLLDQYSTNFRIVFGKQPLCFPLAQMSPVLPRKSNNPKSKSKSPNFQLLIGMVSEC